MGIPARGRKIKKGDERDRPAVFIPTPLAEQKKMLSVRCVQRLRYAVVRMPQLNLARGLRAVDRNRKGIDELLNKFDQVDSLPPAKGPKGRLQKALEAVKVTALPAAAQGQLDAFGEELTDLLNEAIESKVNINFYHILLTMFSKLFLSYQK